MVERRDDSRTAELDAMIAQLKEEIAGRRQAEAALREQQELWRLLTENTFEFIRLFDAAGNLVYANSAVERLLGAVPASFSDFSHPEDRDATLKWLQRILAGTKEYLHWRVQTQSGEWRWMESQGVVVSYNGAPHILTVCRDITDRKQAEEASRRSEERLRLAIDAIPVMAWTVRPDGVVDFLNRRWMDYSGLSLAQYVADPTGPIHPDDVDRALAKWRAKMAAGEGYEDEMRLRGSDGKFRWFLVRTAPLRDEQGHIVKWYGVSTDIDDRKWSEQAVRNNQQLLQEVLATLPVGVAVTDLAGDIVLVNAASKRIWSDIIVSGRERRTRSKGFQYPSGERIEPEKWASVRAIREGQTTLSELIGIEAFDGQKKTIQNSAAPIRDAEGSIVGAIIVNEDVTERVRAEEALRESERKLKQAQRLAQIGYWERDLVTDRITWSQAVDRILGTQSGTGLCEADLQRMIHPDDRQLRNRALADALKSEGSYEVEFRVIRPDGDVRFLHVWDEIDRDSSGRPIRLFGTVQDVTDRKRAEDALCETSDRLQHLSRRLLEVQEEERRHLSRELHDEFGQLLAAISLHLHVVRGVAGDAARAGLEECLALLQRAGEQVRSLTLELRPTMLETAGIDATLRRLAEDFQQRSGITTRVTGYVNSVSSDLAVACFRVAQEALTNVVRHAQAQHVWIELSRNESDLELLVRDDGVGFDTMSTLKQAAQHGRLGLLGMRERVEILGGTLQVESKPGHETRIRVSFPLERQSRSMEQ